MPKKVTEQELNRHLTRYLDEYRKTKEPTFLVYAIDKLIPFDQHAADYHALQYFLESDTGELNPDDIISGNIRVYFLALDPTIVMDRSTRALIGQVGHHVAKYLTEKGLLPPLPPGLEL